MNVDWECVIQCWVLGTQQRLGHSPYCQEFTEYWRDSKYRSNDIVSCHVSLRPSLISSGHASPVNSWFGPFMDPNPELLTSKPLQYGRPLERINQ